MHSNQEKQYLLKKLKNRSSESSSEILNQSERRCTIPYSNLKRLQHPESSSILKSIMIIEIHIIDDLQYRNKIQTDPYANKHITYTSIHSFYTVDPRPNKLSIYNKSICNTRFSFLFPNSIPQYDQLIWQEARWVLRTQKPNFVDLRMVS